MHEYQQNMLKQSTIDSIRGKISDFHTQNVSAYDPSGLESLETYELLIANVDRTKPTNWLTAQELLTSRPLIIPALLSP